MHNYQPLIRHIKRVRGFILGSRQRRSSRAGRVPLAGAGRRTSIREVWSPTGPRASSLSWASHRSVTSRNTDSSPCYSVRYSVRRSMPGRSRCGSSRLMRPEIRFDSTCQRWIVKVTSGHGRPRAALKGPSTPNQLSCGRQRYVSSGNFR